MYKNIFCSLYRKEIKLELQLKIVFHGVSLCAAFIVARIRILSSVQLISCEMRLMAEILLKILLLMLA